MHMSISIIKSSDSEIMEILNVFSASLYMVLGNGIHMGVQVHT